VIGIVDYGVGNLFSLKSSLDYLNLEAEVTNNPDVLDSAERIILPGVGAFGDAMEKLSQDNLDQAVLAQAKRGKPLLGICLGMQMLFEKSLEYGEHRGLGLLGGIVAPLAEDIDTGSMKVPHMGWNSLVYTKTSALQKYIREGDYVYYVHSYYAKDTGGSLAAYSEYGVRVAGMVGRDNIYGTQFHPEKSGRVGLAILQAFGEI